MLNYINIFLIVYAYLFMTKFCHKQTSFNASTVIDLQCKIYHMYKNELCGSEAGNISIEKNPTFSYFKNKQRFKMLTLCN